MLCVTGLSRIRGSKDASPQEQLTNERLYKVCRLHQRGPTGWDHCGCKLDGIQVEELRPKL